MTDTNHFSNGMEFDGLPPDFIDDLTKTGVCIDEEYLNSAWRKTNAIVHDALSGGLSGLGSDVWVINKKDLSTQKVKAFTKGDKFLGNRGRNPYHKPCNFQFEAEIVDDSYSRMELASCIMPFRSPIPFVRRDLVSSLLGVKPWEAQLLWTIALQCRLVPADYGYLLVYTTESGTELFTRCEINKPGWYLPDPYTEPVYVFSRNNKK